MRGKTAQLDVEGPSDQAASKKDNVIRALKNLTKE